MKTKVKVIADDQRHKDYSKDEIGYIDGYCRGGDGAPYACVVIACSRIVMIPLRCLEVIPQTK